MATVAEKRAWLVDHGHPELQDGRGRLRTELHAEYDAAHPTADDYGEGTSPDDFPGDLPFVTADDPPDEGITYDEEPGAVTAEEKPSRPHAPRFGWHRKQRAPKAKGKGKTWKRVSIAPFIEDAYGDIAWAAAGLGPVVGPPMQRLLYAQAPIAGAVLDPVVKDTVADRIVLQPLARNYERVKVATALLGTPAALFAVLATAPGPALGSDGKPLAFPVVREDGSPVLNEDGQPVMGWKMAPPSIQHQSSMLMLRYGVRAMADVAGDSMKRVQERAELNAERDGLVDEFIAFLLGTVVPPGAEETAAREGRDAGLKLAGVAGG